MAGSLGGVPLMERGSHRRCSCLVQRRGEEDGQGKDVPNTGDSNSQSWVPEAQPASWAWIVSPYSSDCSSTPQGW